MTDDFQRSSGQPDVAQIAAEGLRIDWPGLERIVHHDPAGRGLASFRVHGKALDAGQLPSASLELATHATAVGIVTGFCAVVTDGVTAETDGPPGALYLVRALLALGVEVTLISDRYALPLLACGCEQWQLDRATLVEFPFGNTTDRWLSEFFASERGRRLTHLIAIERPGPGHTLESLVGQARDEAAPLDRFTAEVPVEERDVCHNMRGQSVEEFTARTHRLFEAAREQTRPIITVGIGDGGNEIGMGQFAWETLVTAIGSPAGARIACRIATDFTLLAGVSDWAAYALALAVVRLRGATELAHDWNAAGQRELIEQLIRQTTAVDGVTLRREATVDGLSLDVYLQPLADMRKLLGCEPA